MDIKAFFGKWELIPAIVQQYDTKEVLMLAYVNEESFELTLQTGQTWFWSRSRNELWNKGATSKNTQEIKEIYYDCEENSFLFLVDQTGVPCHTGNKTCYFRKIILDKNKI